MQLDQDLAQGVAFDLQVFQISLPALLVSLHGGEDIDNGTLVLRALLLHIPHISPELFVRQHPLLDIGQRGVERPCGAVDDLLNLLIARQELRSEFLIVQHVLKHIQVRHWQLQVADAVLDILGRDDKVLGRALEKGVDFVDVGLQNLDDFLVRLGLVLVQEMHAEDDLRHQLGEGVVLGGWALLPSSRPRLVELLGLEQVVSPHGRIGFDR